MSVSPSLRFQVFTRDGFRCRYCGRSADDGARLQADHIHPRAKGGLDEMDNLVTACWDCNIGKSARVLRPIPKSRRPRRMFPAVPLIVEEPPLYVEGASCSTPLKIAAIGRQCGITSYAGAYRFVKSLPKGPQSPEMPPLRAADRAWFRYCELNTEPQEILIAALARSTSIA